MSTNASVSASPPALKILMLHGYTQSGPLFHAKTRALEKSLVKTFPSSTLHYPTAPIPLHPADIPGFTPSSQTPSDDTDEEASAFGWWRRKDGTPVYEGIEKGLERVASTIRAEGPFDGVIGFSQGGAMAGMVASLLEPGRRESMDALRRTSSEKFAYPSSFLDDKGGVLQRPLKFAIIYSGFAAPLELYSGFYEPKVKTPVLIVVGGVDTVVEENRTKLLIECCEGGEGRVVTHPGGHFVPSGKQWLDAVLGFVSGSVGEADGKGARKEEQRVEDMDMPY